MVSKKIKAGTTKVYPQCHGISKEDDFRIISELKYQELCLYSLFVKTIKQMKDDIDQIKKQAPLNFYGKTPISELKKCEDIKIPKRILDILFGKYSSGTQPFKYIEDINEYDFLKIRNAGSMAWEEMNKILIEYRQKIILESININI